MVIRGFDETTMRKSFEWFLHDSSLSFGERRTFQTRNVQHSGKGSNANLNDEQMEESEIEFKNSMALLYLKTFYGKKPADFKTEAYKKECERFRSVIESSPNPSSLNAKIEKCLRDGHVNYNSGELPRSVFYERLSEIGLSTDDTAHKIFISPEFITQARIYINPSRKDYAHLMTFLYERAASQELAIGTKTRMSSIGESSLDNMIIYTTAKDFPKIVEILNEYGRIYPDKVAQFGDTIECLGRSEQDWFGFGYDIQRDINEVSTRGTFNNAIDDLFNSYILPAIMFDDFGEITREMGEVELTEIFKKMCKDEDLAKEIALSLQDPILRRKFINNFCDLTYLKEKSNGFTRENAKLSEAERKGCSPEQLRFRVDNISGSGQPNDFIILRKEKITIPLRDGRSVVFSRADIAQIMKSNILRTAMEKFYDTEAKVTREVSQMLWLWKYSGKNMPYLNDTYPFLNNDMVRGIEEYEALETMSKSATSKTSTKELPEYEKQPERQTIKEGIEEKHKRQEEIIKVLCSENFQIASKLFKMGVAPEEMYSLSQANMEELFISKVGLDNVIEAASYVKSIETDKNKLNHRYENTLQALRYKRGKALCEKIRNLPSKKERTSYALTLSQYAREDVIKAYQMEKCIAKMDEFIRNL